jgi:DNA primase
VSEDLLESNLPEPCLNYLHDRGFCDAAIQEWGLGYDPISDRIAIPVRDEEGTLVGFKGRAYRPEHKPKYLILGDRPKRQKRYGFSTYEVGEIAFGLDRFIEEAPTYNHHLIIVEGELDVISLWQSGIKNSIACGSNFSSTHRELITAWANSVTLFLDDDPAGNRASEKIAKELSPYMPVQIVGPHEGDAASLTAEQCCKLIREAETYDTIQITQD